MKVNVSIKNRKIRIALVGCGRISDAHYRAIKAHQDHVELVNICDNDPNALKKNEEVYQVKGFSTLEDLLKYSDADLIVLCTPSGLHSSQAIQAVQAGKHVMTEKPMATRWEDGLRMVEESDKMRKYLFVVKQNRRNATLRLLKKAIQQRRFGRIYMVNVNVFWTRPQNYYDQAKWRGTWEFDGGALMNQASHYVDLLDWLIGPVASVHAMIGTLARNIEVEDTAVLNLRWRSGALGSANVTMLTYPKNLEGSITILGEKGSVKIGGVAANEIQHWEFADQQPEDDQIKNASYQTSSVYGHGHPLYYENVIQVLQGEAMPETDGREGLRSLELLIAAYLSARDKCEVSLPLRY